ncbi:aspartate/glutamate racemase family protein [Mycobacterium angelicum]|uniref:Hydantoin racemase n=1 Tax=Mycobacterium angelicum TaxID=470074 RepID=A0A1W9ZXK2_MYCAN|nr:aspartate/glutamate racemase family protein [Mycobacterium angelicum]MCV7199758.1 hydantoin racemase [Mycobacterium angelicum]ORA22206.1 hypothetical protein BST12_10450 [Mycobacterium angelicum]
MKIWLQKHIVKGRMPALDDWYEQHIEAVVDPGTEVVIHTLPRRTYDYETPYDYVQYGVLALRFSQYFAETAAQAERDGYDAWVIAAGQDPGLTGARALATIPTLGLTRTASSYCAQQDVRYSFIGMVPCLKEPIIENVRRYRTDHLLASYELVPGSIAATTSAIAGDPDQFLGEFAEAAARARAAGAQVILPATGLPAEIVWHYEVREVAGLPVLDPLGLLLKSAEAEVRLRALRCTARTDVGYWFARPDAAVVDHIDSVFASNRIEQEHPV